MPRDFLELRNVSAPLQAAAVECKFAGAEGRISGYGSVFGNADAHGDIVAPGAFAASLQGHKAAGTNPMMLWQHDTDEPIGIWEDLEEDGRGLKLSGKLNLDTQRGREALALVKQGAINGLSIGFRVAKGGAEIDPAGNRKLTKLDLWEVSLVTFPSNGKARLSGTKQVETRDAYESFLRDAGFAKSAARKLAAGGWPALSQDEPAALELLAAVKSTNTKLKELIR